MSSPSQLSPVASGTFFPIQWPAPPFESSLLKLACRIFKSDKLPWEGVGNRMWEPQAPGQLGRRVGAEAGCLLVDEGDLR